MNKWMSENCDINGINVHYTRTGDKKPPVILLHGLMLSGACWAPLARSLEQHYDVIMPDARGHGYSASPEQDYTYDNLASDVMKLIKALKLNNPILLGHSMGGMIAAVAASKMGKELRGLVLADPTFLTPQQQYDVVKSDVLEQHRQVLAQPKHEYLTTARLRHTKRSTEVIALFAQARYQTSLHAFNILTPPSPDFRQLISDINIPCQLIIGDTDPVVSTETASELAKLNHHIQIKQITHAGHGLPFDQPVQFSTVVQTFLSSI